MFPKEYTQDAQLIANIRKEISGLLDAYLPPTLGMTENQTEEITGTIYVRVFEDLISIANRDPAAKGKADYVLKSYSSFKAVMYFRVANTIHECDAIIEALREGLARQLSERANIETGIDIHPAAKIGKRFVIDHGVGTTIGETCEIGDDCYVLQGVILGGPGIADNPSGKRQPTIGNRVQIGAFVRIFGPVTIGDDVFIAPYCMVDHDIPSRNRVVIINQLQLTTPRSSTGKMRIYGVLPEDTGSISIYGENLEKVERVSIVEIDDKNFKEIEGLEISVLSKQSNHIKIKISLQKSIREKFESMILRLIAENDFLYITKSLGLRKVIENIKKEEI